MDDKTDGASRRTAAGLTPAQLRVVATLGFCGLVSAADNWFVSPALPAIAQTLSVAPVAATVILTAYMLPYGTLQPVCGSIADRIGRLRLLRIIVLGLCAGTFLCAVVPSLPLLVVARIVTGCFAAGIIAVSQAFVSDVVAPEQRGGAVGILMGITFTGQGLSAGLGGILTDVVGWRAAFATFGVLAALAWLGLLGLRLGLLGMESGLEIAIAALMFFFPMMMGSFAFSLAGAAIIAFGAIAVVSCFWSLRVASAMREAERRARSDIGRFDEV